jgi:hypothetical protein
MKASILAGYPEANFFGFWRKCERLVKAEIHFSISVRINSHVIQRLPQESNVWEAANE